MSRRGTAPVRVVFCIDNAGVGGTELNALRTATRLDRARFDVSVVCLQDTGPLLSRFREQGIPVLTLPIGSLYGPRMLRQGRRFTQYLTEHQVDIVHSHDVYDNIFASAWARAARTPVVIASRRWWDHVPRSSLRAANRQAYRLAHCVLANSPAVGALLVDAEGVRAERVAVIPNFVDEAAFAAPSPEARRAGRAALGVPADAIVAGCVASLRPVKDQESLIIAAAVLRTRWPRLHVVLVGEGESRAALEGLAARLGVSDHVHFAGLLPNDPNLHHLFDISVLPSLSEAFPNSVIEAMAAARPVVATRVGGVPDAITDRETGRLVPPASPETLAAAIEQLLRAPDQRRSLGLAAQQRARERFHADRVIAQVEGLYDRLLAAGGRLS